MPMLKRLHDVGFEPKPHWVDSIYEFNSEQLGSTHQNVIVKNWHQSNLKPFHISPSVMSLIYNSLIVEFESNRFVTNLNRTLLLSVWIELKTQRIQIYYKKTTDACYVCRFVIREIW